MDFLQRTPFFRLLLPLIIGIITYQYVEFFQWSLMLLLGVSVFLILLGFAIRNATKQFQFRWFFGFGTSMLLFTLGYFLSNQYDKNNTFQYINKQGIFKVELTESPIEKENSYLCRVKTIQYFENSQAFSSSGKAIVYVQKDSASAHLQSGDRLLIQTTFQKPDGAVNPNGFDYYSYLKRQGIGATAYLNSDRWVKTDRNETFSIFRLAESAQQNLLNIYRRFGITGDEYAVLAALTLGSKDALHPELRQNYTTSGGMHILAVSGLHVGIIFMVLSFLLKSLNRTPRLKYLKALLIVLLLWAYAFITGLPPSVIRATSMFSLMAIGASLERKSHIYNTISVAAFIMLLINPNFLFDVGFQLSFSAVVSIVYFQPKISKWFAIENKMLRWAWELTAVSLAAQIGTAPFSLFYFQQFPNYFLITNFVAIPFASFIIYTAVALFVLSPVPYISVAVAFVLQWMLKILNFLIEFIHHLPYSITITAINFWQVLFAFGTIILFSTYLQNKSFKAFLGSLILILAFLCVNVYVNYQSLNSSRMVVFADNKSTHVNFITGKNNFVFTTDSANIERVGKNFWLNNKLNKPQMIDNEKWFSNGFAEFNGKRFLILTDQSLNRKTTLKPLAVDYLIVGNKLKLRMAEVLRCIEPAEVIVDKSISGWYTEHIRQICSEKNIPFYSVAEKGAYVVNFTD